MRYNPKTFENTLTRFIARQEILIGKLIDEAVTQSVLETERFGVHIGEGEDFFFKNYPGLSRKVDGVLRGLSGRMDNLIQSGIEWGWELANKKNDDMVWKVINSIGNTRVPYDAPERWMQKNLPALEAFENRRIGGMGLSERVWNYASGIKGDLELALDLGLGEGKSADRLSRDVRGYLHEPARLYRRVRDEKGVLRLSKSASNYHPGQGVYRSSYKNAKRLTATETNMAYRAADYERNQQLDFVLGIEIHLSNNHTCLNAKGEPEPFFDICDELQGRYPADFKFTGWHPLCRCYTTTILPSQEEMIEYLASMDENGNSDYEFSGRVEEIPPQMNQWLAENEERVLKAKSLPYFIRDNPQISVSSEMTQKIDYSLLANDLQNQERNGVIALDTVSAPDATPSKSLEQILQKEWAVENFYSGPLEDTLASQFDLIGFKNRTTSALSAYGIEIENAEVRAYPDGSILFGMSSRNEAFNIVRSLERGKEGVKAHHYMFTIPQEMQGKGISKEITKLLYSEYKKAGVTRIELDANKVVGGYCWARYGFYAPDKEAVKYILIGKEKHPHLEDAKGIIEGFYKGKKDSTPFPMHLISNTSWGKEFLIKTSWSGVLDFSNPEQVEIFEKYLGLR